MQVLGALLLLKFSFYNIIHIDIAGKLPKPNRVELSNMNTDLYPVSIKKNCSHSDCMSPHFILIQHL